MPSTHGPFVQPASLHNVQFSFSIAAELPASANSRSLDRPALIANVYWHAPPVLPVSSLSPLRI
jgi:hypothetical protein